MSKVCRNFNLEMDKTPTSDKCLHPLRDNFVIDLQLAHSAVMAGSVTPDNPFAISEVKCLENTDKQ